MRSRLMLVPVVVAVALSLGACSSSKSSGTNSTFCKHLRELSTQGESLLPRESTDSPEYKKAVDELKKLEKEAPSQLRADIASVLDALDKLQNGKLTELTDPAFATKLEKATKNLEAYSSGTCKITTPTTTR
jgi:hypothetical protein